MKRNWIYILAIVLLLIMAWYFHTIIAYILVAGVFSLIGEPLVKLLLKIQIKGRHLPRAAAALLTILTMFTVWGALVAAFIPMVAVQARKLSQTDINELLQRVQGPILSIQDRINEYGLSDKPIVIENELKRFLAEVLDLSDIGSSLTYVAGLMGDVFIAFFSITFITFFFLKDEGLFRNMIMTLVPSGYEERAERVLIKSKELLTRYFIGLMVQMAIIMTMVSIGLTLAGVENAVLIGFMAGIFNIIPYIGPMIGAALGIIIGLASTAIGMEMMEILWLTGKMMLVFGITQVTDNVVLQPLIYSQSVKAHPLEIFLVILMAGNLAGIPGMILAIPTYSIVRVFVGEFFHQFKVVKALTKEV